MDLQAGQIFDGKLEIIHLIGQGAMGAVYKARHTWMNRIVALKVMTPSELNSLRRFKREVALLAAVEHPNVVHIQDAGVCGNRPYMVMELLPGCSLEALLAAQGPQLDLARALWIAGNVAEALTTMHAKEVVHRDLKPPNIQILDPDGAEPRVKVLDFGISTTLRPSTKITQGERALGTPQYMSPEQALAAPVDSRSDMYALGCLLYEMLAGRAPFDDARAMVVAAQHINAPVPDIRRLRPEVPDGVVAILDRCLQKTPGARFRATAELRDACMAAYDLLSDDDGPEPTIMLHEHEAPTRPFSRPDLSDDELTATVTSMPEFRPPVIDPTAPRAAPAIRPAPRASANRPAPAPRPAPPQPAEQRRPNQTRLDPMAPIPRGPQGTAVELSPVPRTSRPPSNPRMRRVPTPAPSAPPRRESEKTAYLPGLSFPDAPAPVVRKRRKVPLALIIVLLLLVAGGIVAALMFGPGKTSGTVVPGTLPPAPTTRAPATAAAPTTQAPALPKQLTQAQITAVIKANHMTTTPCLANTKRPGGAELTVTIGGDGRVQSARPAAKRGLSKAARDCLAEAVKAWRFPPFSGPPVAVKIKM